MIPYDCLHLVPSVLAETVVEQSNLTKEQKANFVDSCDRRCRLAYSNKSHWFMKILRANGNNGRDQLEMFIEHWLKAFELNQSVTA